MVEKKLKEFTKFFIGTHKDLEEELNDLNEDIDGEITSAVVFNYLMEDLYVFLITYKTC